MLFWDDRVAMMNLIALMCLFIHEHFMTICILFWEELGPRNDGLLCAWCTIYSAGGGGALCVH